VSRFFRVPNCPHEDTLERRNLAAELTSAANLSYNQGGAVVGTNDDRRTGLPNDVDHWVRRGYHQVAIALGALALFASVMTVFLLVRDGPPALLYVLILALLAAFLWFQAWISERNFGRMRDFLRILNPASREVDYVHWQGIRTIFDNGLVLQTYNPGNGPNGLVFGVFLGADGAVLTPRPEDLTSWSRAFPPISARGLRVQSHARPNEYRMSLEPVRVRLGSDLALAAVYSSFPTMVLPPGGPRDLVVSVFLDRGWMTKGRLVVSERDAILACFRALTTKPVTSPPQQS